MSNNYPEKCHVAGCPCGYFNTKQPSESSTTPERDAGFLVPEAKNVSAGLETPGMTISAPTFTEEWESAPRAMRQEGQLQRLRAALFDVMDGGCTCGSEKKHPWELNDDTNDPEQTEDIVNAQRARFVDTVWLRLLELRQKTGAATEQESAEYWFLRGVQAGRAEMVVTTNGDLREILRVTRERII